MGWLKLAFLAALAVASCLAWKNDAEYVYKFKSKILSGNDDGTDEHTGIYIKGRFHMTPKGDEAYMAKMSDVQYVQIHSHLYDGWQSNIPDNQLSYKPLTISNNPFKIVMKKGVVKDLYVAQNTPEWETNMIKGLVSQMQFDTTAENLMESKMNQLPKQGGDFGVFKTMEETVTGDVETLYEIKPFPDYIAEREPWLIPSPQLENSEGFIEIFKSRNYSNSEQRPSFNYGFYDDAQPSHKEPSANTMGQYFIRNGFSRAIISGTLQRFTIQSIQTTSVVALQSDLSDKLYGRVISQFNMTLHSVQPSSSIPSNVASLKPLGNLVYSFEEQNTKHASSKENSQEDSSEENYSRSLGSDEDLQRKPRLNEPLRSSLLIYDFSDEEQFRPRVAQAVKEISKEIAQDLEEPEKLDKTDTLEEFVMLTNLLRTLNEQELQTIANELYTTEKQGHAARTWMTFRDAVAESGTGPAFLTVEYWIKNRKISGQEAAYVVERMAKSVVQPTDEYMKAFFNMITQPEVEQEQHLNVSSIASFSELVNHVYIHKRNSHNKFPVHNYGHFATDNGKEFVINEYIPYLKHKLQNAIARGENDKIYAYITATGIVAHKKILEVFEPYLEGQHKITQFQRTYMVSSLRNLAKVNPEAARAVMFRIYQNIGEYEDVRIVAAYNLMLTDPPRSMLQRMAQYTIFDQNENVRSAVKSIIMSAANLNGQRYVSLRANARAALPLLTRKEFGLEYSKGFMNTVEHHELDVIYQQTLNWIGSRDSIIPKALFYSWNENTGGFMQPLALLKARVSSVADLIDEIKDLLDDSSLQQKLQDSAKFAGNEFSAENIAKLLNIHPNEREELEGVINYHFFGLSGLYSINNASIRHQLHNLKRLGEKLTSGMKIQDTKIVDHNKLMVSFPMEMGTLFVYSLNKPLLIQIDGQISASSQPQMIDNQKISIPDVANFQADLTWTVARKVQARLGFVFPYDGHYYTAGSDQHVQFYTPFVVSAQFDLKNQQIKTEFQMKEPQKDVRIFHTGAQTYTTHYDVKEFKPIKEMDNTRIHHEKQQKSEKVYGESVGMKFKVSQSWEEDELQGFWNPEDLLKQRGFEKFVNRLHEQPIGHRHFDIKYLGSQSPNQKMKFTFGLKMSENVRENQKLSEQSQQSFDLRSLAQTSQQPHERLHEMFRKVAGGIKHPRIYAIDADMQFLGQSPAASHATFALAASPVHEKSRAMFYYNRKPSTQSSHQSYQMAVVAETKFPNTNGLNFEYALKFDPSSTVEIEAAFGKDLQSGEKVTAEIQFQQSERMQQYLKNLANYYLNRNKEMYGFDNLYPSQWAFMTSRSNVLDHVAAKIKYHDLSDTSRTMIQFFYDTANLFVHEYKNETYQRDGNNNELEVHFDIDPKLQWVNASIKTPDRRIKYSQVPIQPWFKPVVSFHPVFSAPTRVIGELVQYRNYRPNCVFDQDYVSTFDNTSYPTELQNDWTVALFYEPRLSSEHQYREQQQERLQQLKLELREEQYVVLVRSKSGSEEKEVKIVFRSPENEWKHTEIDLTPSGGKPKAKVTVNKQPQEYNDQEVTTAEDGSVEIYALPNGEVKVEIRNAFYVIYDGSLMKISVTDDKFHGHILGLCGSYTGHEATDLQDPQNNVIGNYKEFVDAYTLSRNQQQKYQQQTSGKNTQRRVEYGDYISKRDMEYHGQSSHGSTSGCYRHQTQYVEQPNKVCFTVRSVPTCQKGCQPTKSLTKDMQVHCVDKNQVTDLWKKQIDMGANPDFSQKTPNRSIKMTIPLKCSPTTY